jgi:hypothetical protein
MAQLSWFSSAEDFLQIIAQVFWHISESKIIIIYKRKLSLDQNTTVLFGHQLFETPIRLIT